MSIVGRIASLLILMAAAAVPARADSPDQPLAFAPRLVAAINGKNLERRRSLLHPKTLACVTPQTRPFLEEALGNQFRHTIPADYKSRAEAIPAGRPLPFADSAVFPVRPTHEVHIDFDTGPHRSVTIIVFLAYTGSGWRQVWPCVRPEKVPQMQAAKEARVKHD